MGYIRGIYGETLLYMFGGWGSHTSCTGAGTKPIGFPNYLRLLTSIMSFIGAYEPVFLFLGFVKLKTFFAESDARGKNAQLYMFGSGVQRPPGTGAGTKPIGFPAYWVLLRSTISFICA